MAQFARPTSDISAGTWTPSTGSTLFGVLDESSASDADFVSNNNNTNDSCEVGLGTVTDPGVHTGHTVRYRYSKSAAGGNARNITVGLYQGGTLIAEQSHTGISEAWTAGSFTLSEGQAGNITDYSNLRIRFTASGTTGGPGGNRRAVQASWAELEVPDGEIAVTPTFGQVATFLPLVMKRVAVTVTFSAVAALVPDAAVVPPPSAYPIIAASAQTVAPTGTSHTLALPDGITAGELLLLLLTDLSGNGIELTELEGWTQLAFAFNFRALYRYADGGEGSSIGYDTAGSIDILCDALRITQHDPEEPPRAASFENTDGSVNNLTLPAVDTTDVGVNKNLYLQQLRWIGDGPPEIDTMPGEYIQATEPYVSGDTSTWALIKDEDETDEHLPGTVFLTAEASFIGSWWFVVFGGEGAGGPPEVTPTFAQELELVPLVMKRASVMPTFALELAVVPQALKRESVTPTFGQTLSLLPQDRKRLSVTPTFAQALALIPDALKRALATPAFVADAAFTADTVKRALAAPTFAAELVFTPVVMKRALAMPTFGAEVRLLPVIGDNTPEVTPTFAAEVALVPLAFKRASVAPTFSLEVGFVPAASKRAMATATFGQVAHFTPEALKRAEVTAAFAAEVALEPAAIKRAIETALFQQVAGFAPDAIKRALAAPAFQQTLALLAVAVKRALATPTFTAELSLVPVVEEIDAPVEVTAEIVTELAFAPLAMKRAVVTPTFTLVAAFAPEIMARQAVTVTFGVELRLAPIARLPLLVIHAPRIRVGDEYLILGPIADGQVYQRVGDTLQGVDP